jgi:hypothetical protein
MKKLKAIWNKKNTGALIVKFLAFTILVAMVDFVTGNILSHFYSKQISGWEYPTKYSIEDTREDLLIFGASRAQEQYKPICFEDSLKISAYNVGKTGMSIPYHYGVFKCILKRYTPKIIILDFENQQFLKADKNYETLSCLLPFYKGHPELQPLLQLRGPFEKYKMISAAYPYNSLLFKIIIGNTRLKNNESLNDKGYIALTRQMDQPLHTVNFSTPYEIDSIKVTMYKYMIEECKKRNIKLFVVCSPYYINQVGTDVSMEMGKSIAAKNNIDFIDYSKKELFLKSPQLFDDTVHVNTIGATTFSNMLASDIKKRLAIK